MKRHYTHISLTELKLEQESPILAGSLTAVPVKVKNVRVHDYDNGFGDNPFADVSFD